MQTPHIIELPKIQDPRGNLTFMQYGDHLPFEIQRVFWTYDVPGGEIRGGHAYQKQEELIVALSGAVTIVTKDHLGRRSFYELNRSYYGLYVPPMTWRHMENFATNTLCLHLSSSKFDNSDYIRNEADLLKIQKQNGVH